MRKIRHTFLAIFALLLVYAMILRLGITVLTESRPVVLFLAEGDLLLKREQYDPKYGKVEFKKETYCTYSNGLQTTKSAVSYMYGINSKKKCPWIYKF